VLPFRLDRGIEFLFLARDMSIGLCDGLLVDQDVARPFRDCGYLLSKVISRIHWLELRLTADILSVLL
jgi:hypothetical protein